MRMIFHYPQPLEVEPRAASGIRPLKMVLAFQSLGYQVDLVTGYAADRKCCIAKVKENIRNGIEYDFIYSESSTMPTILTEKNHFPSHPLTDWIFLRYCKAHNIAVGLFYRDIYWRFDNYGVGLSSIKRVAAKVAYRFDLWVYKQTVSKLYLPSIKMGHYVPKVNPAVFEALPPGHSLTQFMPPELPDLRKRPLKLFYVGGMSSHYQLHKLFKVVSQLPQIELTVCTRQSEWQSIRNEYPVLLDNIRIIHETGAAMEAELKSADIAVLFVKPQEYWEFAAPVKLYEYLGFCKPILASEGTLAGQFVRDNNIGWTIPYEEEAVQELLTDLARNPVELANIHRKLKEIAHQHTWEARAQKVIKDLTQ